MSVHTIFYNFEKLKTYVCILLCTTNVANNMVLVRALEIGKIRPCLIRIKSTNNLVNFLNSSLECQFVNFTKASVLTHVC